MFSERRDVEKTIVLCKVTFNHLLLNYTKGTNRDSFSFASSSMFGFFVDFILKYHFLVYFKIILKYYLNNPATTNKGITSNKT